MTNNPKDIIKIAQEVLEIEAHEILHASENISSSFVNAVNLIIDCSGRVVLSGMGKSGHIARKIASTLASTGTPAFFMHPGEASHGDLGMITKNDIVIIFSNSGQSSEVSSIIPNIKRIGAKIISICSNSNSDLAIQSDIHISSDVKKEACPLGLAPTASSTVSLALGDALAICTLSLRGFTADDFAESHPGGSLGKNLLTKIKDIMRIDNLIPKVTPQSSLKDAIVIITEKKVGFTAVIDEKNKPIGILTDGDLRRALIANKTISSSVNECMTKNPIVLKSSQLAVDAVNIMEKSKVNSFLVVNEKNELVGIVNLQDLLKGKVI
ncbi:MAG: KpsF/GutQ family sugar-phosphate isomerase [Methylophilaceae bacterium]|jgi:arabinose-5-phosphate isomerase|nr:KpsF/GutQ family sugar-phosphate isomerase [Methylophilaceae bacterium]